MGEYYILGDGGHAVECKQWMINDGLDGDKIKLVGKKEEKNVDIIIGKFFMGLGKPADKKKCYECLDRSIVFKTFISSKSIFHGNIFNGSFIAPFNLISVNTKIGNFVTINYGCSIGHDSKIGDFCSIMPGARISGNVNIGEETFIGAGAVVLENITIGKKCVIGAGAVITRNVPDFETWVGVPARKIK